jgi:hypothetical protein
LGSAPWVCDVSFAPASPADVRRGLVGFVGATIDGVLRLEGMTLRRSRAGHDSISFPCRRDRRGRKHQLVRPIGPGLEKAILDALGAVGDATSRSILVSPRAVQQEVRELARPSEGGAHVQACSADKDPGSRTRGRTP